MLGWTEVQQEEKKELLVRKGKGTVLGMGEGRGKVEQEQEQEGERSSALGFCVHLHEVGCLRLSGRLVRG